MSCTDNDVIRILHFVFEHLTKLLRRNPEVVLSFLQSLDDASGLDIQSNIEQLGKSKDHSSVISAPKSTKKGMTQKPIEKAVEFLNNNFEQIPSVEMWAEGMGYSYQNFLKKFVAHFDKCPQTILIKRKKIILIEYFRKNATCNFRQAAKRIHLQDGNGLWQFVKREFGCTPTKLKHLVIEGYNMEI